MSPWSLDVANSVKPSTRIRWQFAFAAVGAFNAILGILLYLGITVASFTGRFAWLALAAILVSGFTLAAYSRLRARSRLSAVARSAISPAPPTAVLRAVAMLRHSRIHRLVALGLWSTLASFVVEYNTSRIAALFIVALGPLWVAAGSFAAVRMTARHRQSTIALAGLFCGLLGAWMGSVGDQGAQLGFVWGLTAGGVTARYFASGDPTMSLVSALIGTTIFVGGTALITGPETLAHILERPSGFVRLGFPLITIEAAVVLSGYSIAALLEGRARLIDSDPETHDQSDQTLERPH